MKFKLSLILCLSGFVLLGQQSIHNFGNLQLHNSGLVGFHGDLINDGTFDSNSGFDRVL